MPLYQLPAARLVKVMVYRHTTGHSIDEALDDYARHQERDSKPSAQCGILGMKPTYGMSKGKGLAYEPANQKDSGRKSSCGRRRNTSISCRNCLTRYVKFGFNEHLLHDMHHRLTPIEAARFGKSIEDYRMFWMEDPTPAETRMLPSYSPYTVTPIAVGEVFNSIWDCKQLIEEQLIDYIRTTLTHAGGITGYASDCRFCFAVSGTYWLTVLPICHQSGMAAALHFDLWVPNFGVREYMVIPNKCSKSSRTTGLSITAICIREKKTGSWHRIR